MLRAAVGQAGAAAPVDTATTTAQENPLLVAAAVVGLVVALAVLVWGVRRLRRTSGGSFLRTLGKREEVAVLMHPNPDPDAMASALAVGELAESADVDATLQYSGQIRHQENRAFQTVLELDIDQIDHVSDLAACRVEIGDEPGVAVESDRVVVTVSDYGSDGTVITSLTTRRADYRMGAPTHEHPRASELLEAIGPD